VFLVMGKVDLWQKMGLVTGAGTYVRQRLIFPTPEDSSFSYSAFVKIDDVTDKINKTAKAVTDVRSL